MGSCHVEMMRTMMRWEASVMGWGGMGAMRAMDRQETSVMVQKAGQAMAATDEGSQYALCSSVFGVSFDTSS